MLRYLGTITVPASRTRNNQTTGASVLDLGTLAAGNLNTVVRAHLGGTAGNNITIAATGDSPAAGGVTIAMSGTAVTIHYESGVSTVAAVEAAIAAVANGSKLIDVDVAGTGATVLSAPGDNFTATHLASGAAGAFIIPATNTGVIVRPAGADLAIEVAPDQNNPVVLATSATRGLPLANNTNLSVKLSEGGAPNAVAAWNAGVGSETLNVWAILA